MSRADTFHSSSAGLAVLSPTGFGCMLRDNLYAIVRNRVVQRLALAALRHQRVVGPWRGVE
jgi:hypothetical protein